jgi:hypothetical protein
MGRPVRSHVGADDSARSTYHSRTQRAHRRFIRQPVRTELRAVIAMAGRAIDEYIPAAMTADVAEGYGNCFPAMRHLIKPR